MLQRLFPRSALLGMAALCLTACTKQSDPTAVAPKPSIEIVKAAEQSRSFAGHLRRDLRFRRRSSSGGSIVRTTR